MSGRCGCWGEGVCRRGNSQGQRHGAGDRPSLCRAGDSRTLRKTSIPRRQGWRPSNGACGRGRARAREAGARAAAAAALRGGGVRHLEVIVAQAAEGAVHGDEADGAEGKDEEEDPEEADRQADVLVEHVPLVLRLLRRVAEADAAPPRAHRERRGVGAVLLPGVAGRVLVGPEDARLEHPRERKSSGLSSARRKTASHQKTRGESS